MASLLLIIKRKILINIFVSVKPEDSVVIKDKIKCLNNR